jgi:hypothetical protein
MTQGHFAELSAHNPAPLPWPAPLPHYDQHACPDARRPPKGQKA